MNERRLRSYVFSQVAAAYDGDGEDGDGEDVF